MPDLYMNPIAFGSEEVTFDDGRACAVIYPSDEYYDPIRPGTYPLLVFVHGDRVGNTSLCPPDNSLDYQRWTLVLRELAASGFVVAIPDVHNTLNSPEAAAAVVEETIRWMHFSWLDRATLWLKQSVIASKRDVPNALKLGNETFDPREFGMRSIHDVFGADAMAPGGITTRVGVAGHSWGARAAAIAAARGKRTITALASIAGSWDDNSANQALIEAAIPTFMITGTDDQYGSPSYLRGFWPSLVAPKHQALMLRVDHWDWVPAIQRCDGTLPKPEASGAYRVMSELLLTFLTKYLGRRWYLPSDLIGPPGERQPVLPIFEDGSGAIIMRWVDPVLDSPTMGTAAYGEVDPNLLNWS